MPAVGGVARRASRIAQERSQGQPLLVLDAGNSLVGDREPALSTFGRTSIEAMNRMGYDALALGPRDLVLGAASLRQRTAEAQFAILSANAVVASSGELLAQPFVVREFGGHRIALVGLTGDGSTAEITVRDPVVAARTAVADAARQADIVIVLSNAGSPVNRQIAAEVPGIAVIISGGQAPTGAWQSAQTGTWIYQADVASPGHAGRMLGLAALAFDSTGKLQTQRWQQVSLGPEIADDPAMAAWANQAAQ